MRTRSSAPSLAVLAAFALSACAGFSADGGFAGVESAAKDRLGKDLKWAQTDADSSTTSTGLLGIALGTTATTAGVLIKGYAKYASFSAATVGAILYISTTPGLITSTAPSTATDIVRIIGYQIDATNDVIYFNPSNDWIEL